MKTSKAASFLIFAAALTAAVTYSPRLSAQTARWSVEVRNVDPGATSLPPSFQVAIYENLQEELSKTKRFTHVVREGDGQGIDATEVLLLKTTVEKYTAGSETRRAVTTISGATKLRVRAQLATPDGKIILERTVNGNVRFLGNNLRAAHNLAHNIAKTIKKSSLPQPPLAAVSEATKPALSDDIVVVEVR